MRQITKDSVQTMFDNRKMNKQNMSVSDGVMRLHGNAIAWFNDSENPGQKRKTITISDGGWQTVTTKERLNGILDHLNLGHIFQKDFVWYYAVGDSKVKLFGGSMEIKL